MERRALLLLIFLGFCGLHHVSSQEGAAVENNVQPSQETPTAASGGEQAGESVPIPISDTEPVTEVVDSMTGCTNMCQESCESIHIECEYIDGAIPVLCGDEIEVCKSSCENLCLCQFNCGCEEAEDCDDTCSEDCVTQFKPVMGSAVTTPAAGSDSGAPQPQDASGGSNGLPVVYKKEKNDEDNSNDQD